MIKSVSKVKEKKHNKKKKDKNDEALKNMEKCRQMLQLKISTSPIRQTT